MSKKKQSGRKSQMKIEEEIVDTVLTHFEKVETLGGSMDKVVDHLRENYQIKRK